MAMPYGFRMGTGTKRRIPNFSERNIPTRAIIAGTGLTLNTNGDSFQFSVKSGYKTYVKQRIYQNTTSTMVTSISVSGANVSDFDFLVIVFNDLHTKYNNKYYAKTQIIPVAVLSEHPIFETGINGKYVYISFNGNTGTVGYVASSDNKNIVPYEIWGLKYSL